MGKVIKLSSPATREFWEIPVLYDDVDLLALAKPPGLLTSPDRGDTARPNLIDLLHAGIREGKPWAVEGGFTYLMNAHRLDFEAGGALLLARSKPILIALANIFGGANPVQTWLALVAGQPAEAVFEVDVPLVAHAERPDLLLANSRRGKKAHTRFEVIERFAGYTLLSCRPVPNRPHQVRAHLRQARLPVAGDALYGGRPLLLSSLKRTFRLKPGKTERPLISSAAVHAEKLEFTHPVTGQPVSITAPWPKHLEVAVKYLRRYAPAATGPVQELRG